MSDNILRFVASDPNVLPAEARTDEARRVVTRAFPAADPVEVERHDGVRFIDCGSNLENVLCPSCGTDLLDDMMWTDLMQAAWESGMSQRRYALPCCGSIVALEDLAYSWPVAFGRFSVNAWNPQLDWFHPDHQLGDHETALIADLAAALGTPVKAFWAHI